MDSGDISGLIGDGVRRIDEVAEGATRLSRDIVDISGFLDDVALATKAQATDLDRARGAARAVARAGQAAAEACDSVAMALDGVSSSVSTTASHLEEALGSSRQVLGWVSASGPRMQGIGKVVERVRTDNAKIREVSREVNILAVNARIEAVRAGDAGRGFIVVAEAINALSRQTTAAAEAISETVGILDGKLSELTEEATVIAAQAEGSLGLLADAGTMLEQLAETAREGSRASGSIAEQIVLVRSALADFGPALKALFDSVADIGSRVEEGRKRSRDLIHLGEAMVQHSVEIGGNTADRPLIEAVQHRAAELSSLLETAVKDGLITQTALFSDTYVPIPGTNPEQVMAPFTDLTDRLFPPVQEEALGLDPRIVFCAAVDRNGYLPTHNRKFSRPQGHDAVWNTANCRNRRIFDDRVGLGAGRSTAPFLMQVYRRDMGGGVFALMKDVSAPIRVHGRHWGGLRLAYTF